jgi:L-ascorbate metabolism protein UlaG (beta-lactamase superfamily)
MKLIGEFHKVDIMLACIGGHFTMAPAHAALAAQYVKAKHVVPMHYGTFGLLAGTPDQLKQELAKRKVDARVTVVKPGETVSF